MKTKREYPATHSMSTTWYAVDEDDNVAIIKFNDNGPVPYDVHEDVTMDEVMLDMMITDEEAFPQVANYTEEQALDFLTNAPTTNRDNIHTLCDGHSQNIIQIDVNKESEFLDIIKKHKKKVSRHTQLIAFSKEKGVYYLSTHHVEKLFDAFIDNEIVLKHRKFNFCFDLNEDYVFPKNVFTLKDYDNPFFVYAQPHIIHQFIERVYTPFHPVKHDQIPYYTPVIRLPFKFAETKSFQIAEYCRSMINYKSFSLNSQDEWYALLALSNESCAFFPQQHTTISYIPLGEALRKYSIINHDESKYCVINDTVACIYDEENKKYYKIGSMEPIEVDDDKDDITNFFSKEEDD